MKFIFFANKPTQENFEKTFSGYHPLNSAYLISTHPFEIKSESLPVRKMTDIKDIYKLSAEMDEDCIIAPFGTCFDEKIKDCYEEFKRAGLITWGFSKNNVIYNKFDDSIKYNIIGLSSGAAKECHKDLRAFSFLSTTHIPEILCNL